MNTLAHDTDWLLDQAACGEPTARQNLLERHRQRLRRMVALRLDRRLKARVDPSDVVQEALADAAHKLDGYLNNRPLPFYPWLRRLAWERLVKLQRRHTAGKRNVSREQPPDLPDESALELAQRLIAPDGDPARQLMRDELQARVRAAVKALPEADREVLLLRHVEQLSTIDAAAVLEISTAAMKSRHLRALERLRHALNTTGREELS